MCCTCKRIMWRTSGPHLILQNVPFSPGTVNWITTSARGTWNLETISLTSSRYVMSLPKGDIGIAIRILHHFIKCYFIHDHYYQKQVSYKVECIKYKQNKELITCKLTSSISINPNYVPLPLTFMIAIHVPIQGNFDFLEENLWYWQEIRCWLERK